MSGVCLFFFRPSFSHTLSLQLPVRAGPEQWLQALCWQSSQAPTQTGQWPNGATADFRSTFSRYQSKPSQPTCSSLRPNGKLYYQVLAFKGALLQAVLTTHLLFQDLRTTVHGSKTNAKLWFLLLMYENGCIGPFPQKVRKSQCRSWVSVTMKNSKQTESRKAEKTRMAWPKPQTLGLPRLWGFSFSYFKTQEVPKEIKPVSPKESNPWIFTGKDLVLGLA